MPTLSLEQVRERIRANFPTEAQSRRDMPLEWNRTMRFSERELIRVASSDGVKQ
jgi:hypothetical protein